MRVTDIKTAKPRPADSSRANADDGPPQSRALVAVTPTGTSQHDCAMERPAAFLAQLP
jgi:hypothetical protein